MPRYRYRAYDASGAVLAGEILIASRQAALQALARRDEFAIELEEIAGGAPLPWWAREISLLRPFSSRTLASFLRELSSLIEANLPIDEALRIMAEQPTTTKSMRAIIIDILDRVTSGEMLSQAMAASGRHFPPFVVRLIAAGEISGSLGTAFSDLAAHFDNTSRRAEKIKGQLLYPAVLLIAAVFALAIITVVLVPALKPLFEGAGKSPPALIASLSWVGSALSANAAAVVSVILGSSAAATILWVSPQGRSAVDKVLLKVPVFGETVQQIHTARFSRTLSVLMSHGIPLTEALRVATGVIPNRTISSQIEELAGRVEQGSSLSMELRRPGVFGGLLPRLARIGEETGRLEQMLLKVAEGYERSVEAKLDRLMTMLTPIIIVVIGGFIGFLVISVINAVLSANSLVLG